MNNYFKTYNIRFRLTSNWRAYSINRIRKTMSHYLQITASNKSAEVKIFWIRFHREEENLLRRFVKIAGECVSVHCIISTESEAQTARNTFNDLSVISTRIGDINTAEINNALVGLERWQMFDELWNESWIL